MKVALLPRGSFEEISRHGFIRVCANSGVLQIDHNSIKVLDLLMRWPAVRVVGSIQGGDAQSSRGIGLRPKGSCILLAKDSVLRRKDRRQLRSGDHLRQLGR